MSTAPRSRYPAALHAFLVVSAFAIVFTWLFAQPIITHRYASLSALPQAFAGDHLLPDYVKGIVTL